MNTEFRKEAKNDFEKDYFKLINNSVLVKTMENVRNHIDFKTVTNNRQINKLVSEPNHLPCNKTHFRKFTDNRNQEDRSKNK